MRDILNINSAELLIFMEYVSLLFQKMDEMMIHKELDGITI